MRRAVLVAAVALLAAVAAFSPVRPALAATPSGPVLDAKTWALIDARTGKTLVSHAAHMQRLMASTTKLMTAYLAIRRLPMSRIVTSVDYQPILGESLMGLKPGQRVSVRDLLYGLILLSGNDAAVTLAKAVSGTVPRFVRLMNRTAVRLGLPDTSYENPVGLDAKNQYSTAADLTRLSRMLMAIPRFRVIASSRTAKLRSYRPPVRIETINGFLLDNAWAGGIKTGHTLEAGFILASDGRREATELIGAVMGAPSEEARDAETVKLMDYGFSLYDKRVPIRTATPVARVPVRFEDRDLAVISRRPIRIGVRQGEKLTVSRTLPDQVEGPIEKGERIGSAVVRLDGEKIGKVELLAARDVAAPSRLERAFGAVTDNLPYIVLALLVILSVVLLVRRRRTRKLRSRMRHISRRQR